MVGIDAFKQFSSHRDWKNHKMINELSKRHPCVAEARIFYLLKKKEQTTTLRCTNILCGKAHQEEEAISDEAKKNSSKKFEYFDFSEFSRALGGEARSWTNLLINKAN